MWDNRFVYSVPTLSDTRFYYRVFGEPTITCFRMLGYDTNVDTLQMHPPPRNPGNIRRKQTRNTDDGIRGET